MTKNIKVLFAGEAIYCLETIYKGRNSFSMGKYWEHGGYFIKALEDFDIAYDYLPTQKVAEDFPWTLEEMKQYDVIIVSDVGSDTFLITQRTMTGEKTPNRLKLIEQYVEEGGGFLMWGGYLSFTGFHGKGFFKDTPIEKILQFSKEFPRNGKAGSCPITGLLRSRGAQLLLILLNTATIPFWLHGITERAEPWLPLLIAPTMELPPRSSTGNTPAGYMQIWSSGVPGVFRVRS